MVQQKLKCILCQLIKPQCLEINEEFLGRTLSSIIIHLCGNEVIEINKSAIVCAECAMELWRAEKMMTQVRRAFAPKLPNVNNVPIATATATTPKTVTANNVVKHDADGYEFKCTVCDFSTLKLKLYKTHMLKIHSKTVVGAYTCNLCEIVFTRLDHYNRHQEKNHASEEKVLVKTSVKNEKIDELESKENKKISIKKTLNKEKKDNNTTVLGPIESKESLIKDLDGDLFKCFQCKYSTDKPKIFRRHMIMTHKFDKNECFRCILCKKSYSRPFAFKTHMEKHRDGEISVNNTLNKELPSITISEQTINNAKAMSTPLNAEKQKKNKVNIILNSTPKPHKGKNNLENPVTTDISIVKKKKIKRSLDEPVTPEVTVKKKKTFEKILDETADVDTTFNTTDVDQPYACQLCTKVTSSEKKLQKHILKKHAA